MAGVLQPAGVPHATPEDYDEPSFWEKLRRYALVAGSAVVERALQLYYVIQSPNAPTWAKATAMGGLAYLVLPADAIPDLLPGVGYTDDLGALAAAIGVLATHITPEIRARAEEKLADYFEDTTEEDEQA